jgi:hypothetical protein
LRACKAFGREDFAKTGQLGNALAIQAAQSEHEAVTHHDTCHAHGEHGGHIGMTQAGNHTARDQGHVFWDRDAKTANQEHHEHGQVTVFGEDGHQKLKNVHGLQSSASARTVRAECTGLKGSESV